MRPASLIFESEGRRPQFSTKIKNTYYLYRFPQNKYFSCFWWSVCLKCDLRPSFLKVRDAGHSSQPKSKILIICIDLHKISTFHAFWWSILLKMRPASLIFESEGRRPQFSTKIKNTYYLYRSPQNKYFSCFWWSVCLKCDLRPSFLKVRDAGHSSQPKSKILIICIDLHKISTFHAFGDQFAWNATCVPHFWKWGTQATSQPKSKILIICIDLHKISTFHAFGDQFA
jgi:hypothetical protein